MHIFVLIPTLKVQQSFSKLFKSNMCDELFHIDIHNKTIIKRFIDGIDSIS